MKSIYYQFVNFIQTLHPMYFIPLVCVLFAVILVLIMKFFKVYNGTQKKFEKVSLLIWAIILFAILIYLTNLRG